MMDAKARARIADGGRLEQQEAKLHSLIREGEQLFHGHVIGAVDDATYRRRGAEIKTAAAALGARLMCYSRGVNCINLMPVDVEAAPTAGGGP